MGFLIASMPLGCNLMGWRGSGGGGAAIVYGHSVLTSQALLIRLTADCSSSLEACCKYWVVY